MKNRKRLIILIAIPAVLVAIIALCCIGGDADIHMRDVADVDIGEGYRIKIWTESPGLYNQDWDWDVAHPIIYSKITRLEQTVVSTTYIGLDYEYDYDIKTAFAEDGNLVCVYDTNLWDSGIFIVFDIVSGEAWYGYCYDDESKVRKWNDRYNRLRLENPELPEGPLCTG